MDSLDAQCLLIHVTMDGQRPPDLWRHDRSGELSCAYEGGTTFTWPASDVAEMARRWRSGDQDEIPQQALDQRVAHEHLSAMTAEAGLPAADVVIHSPPRRAARALGEAEGRDRDRSRRGQHGNGAVMCGP
jgi:hypothetical protein